MDGKHLKIQLFLIIFIFIINLTISSSVTAETTNNSLKEFYDFLYEQKYIIWIPIILIIIILPFLILKIKKKKKEKMYYIQEEKENKTDTITDKPKSTAYDEDFENLRKQIDEILKK